MNTLDHILETKRFEVEARKVSNPVKLLEQSVYFNSSTVSLRNSILEANGFGIIAEIKRKSPSKGVINADASVESISRGYVQAGASALSILTDETYFGGTNDDLTIARQLNLCPILRKEFIIDEYQLIEARAIGADAILLIASVLQPKKIKEFIRFAHSLALEVLLEVHNEEEVEANLDSGCDLLGVNNRDLKTFKTNIEVSRRLAPLIPKEFTRISESGIDSPGSIIQLNEYGYGGFLLGHHFMNHRRPDYAAENFINELRLLQQARLIHE